MQPSDISVSCPACGDAESEIGGRLRLLRTLCISVFLTMPLFWNLHPLAQLAIASVLQFWPGAYFYKGAYRALRQGVLGMDFLVAVSTTVIYLHSACIALTVHHDVKLYFLSEGVLLSLILFGKYMECTSRYEASEAIRKLIRLQPETANVLRGGTVQTVDIRTLTSGDIVQVRSGERVPIDGVVLSGSCTVDESMLTGESELIPKCAGAHMYCGTLCREGDVTLSCAAVCEQTVLAQIIAIVSAAQSEKAPVARLADKIATVFVPVVILVTASTINGGYLNFMGNEFGHPEWIDFPREGNGWSHKYARRQWDLVDNMDLKYHFLGDFDREMLELIRSVKNFQSTPIQKVWDNDGDQILAYMRKDLVFVFNFNPTKSFADYGFLVPKGEYEVVLNTDANRFGGFGLADDTIHHFTQFDPLYKKEKKEWLKLYIPARSAVVLKKVKKAK